MSEKNIINIGKISGVFGIKGWVKIFSFTHPKENIIKYSPWLLKKGTETKSVKPIDGALQNKAIIAQIQGVNNRNDAESLMGWDIFISPDQLPETAEDEYYWSDLIGLNVETIHGVQFGVVESLLETGANDVLIIQGDRERVIPFLQGSIIVDIDLNKKIMIVDWDPEF